MKDTLPVAIFKVLNDEEIDDKTKLERIEAYIDVYFDNKLDEQKRNMFS